MKTVLSPIFLIVILLFGCTSSYHASDFTEIQLSDNYFKVSYNGGGVGDEEKTDLTLLRSAEVAQHHGFTYFAIIIEDNYSDTSGDTKPLGGRNSYRTAKPSLSNTILCFKSLQLGPSYDVNVIIPSLRKKYNI
jgi:hypothetical protein